MTENKLEVLKYKDYPEGSGSKRLYDMYFLPFGEYLAKYYSNPNWETWDRWRSRYIEAAFNKNRHDEMIKNFGYADKKYYDFDTQYEFYSQLKMDKRLDDDTMQFIGFLAGAGFFKKYDITLKQWFNMKNWSNPYLSEIKDDKTINEIISYPYGENYIKTNLPQMAFWNR